MKLVVFDIDGTLTLGDGLGTKCFFDAFEAAFSTPVTDRQLTSYRESTDAGIASEVLGALSGNAPVADQMEQFKRIYLELLGEQLTAAPRAYRPVRGAEQVMLRLASEHGWKVAIATGNWQQAAALKLASAGVEIGGAVGAYSEDGHTRAEVLAAAIAKATAHEPVERVVYVGDQPWDKAAADLVGVAFLGIEGEGRRRGLGEAGVRVLPDFAGFEALLSALEECTLATCAPVTQVAGRARPA